VELGDSVGRLSEQQKQLLQRLEQASGDGNAEERGGAPASNEKREARRTADGAGS
jgi:hypothetical protein